SALLREFKNRSVTRGASFAAGKCYEFARGLPYYVLSEALSSHHRALSLAPEFARKRVVARLREELGPLGAELVKVVPRYAEIFEGEREAEYLGEGRDRIRFLQTLARLFAALAPKGEPVVLVL